MGKKSTKTSTTTTLPAWAQNLAQGGANTIMDTVQANQPNLQSLTANLNKQLPGLAGKAFGEQPGLNEGVNYATDVLGGKYLDQQNPYLGGMINATANDVQDRVNSMFAKSGASMGTQHAGIVAKELANAENNLRYGNYAQERQNQQGAASLLPSFTAAQYAGIPAYLSATQTAGSLPYAGLGPLASMGNLWAGQGTTTGTQPGGWGTDLLNAAASIGSAALMASDRRLKTKIKLLKRDPDGLGWYEFAYKSAPDQMRFGVMADEVKELRPQAYVKGFVNGEYDGVNYALLREVA